MYYIVCKRHMYKKDHGVLFWGKNRQGYTFDINCAGLYPESDRTTFDTPKDDDMVDEELMRSHAVISVIDNARLGLICVNNKENRAALGIKFTELLTGNTAWNSRAFCDVKTFVRRNENTVKLLAEIAALPK